MVGAYGHITRSDAEAPAMLKDMKVNENLSFQRVICTFITEASDTKRECCIYKPQKPQCHYRPDVLYKSLLSGTTVSFSHFTEGTAKLIRPCLSLGTI